MAATLPVWAVGRHYTQYTLIPQSVDSTGGLTDITASQGVIFGNLRNVRTSSKNTLENLSSMDRQRVHMVVIERGTVYEATEMIKYAGVNLLAFQAYNFDIFKLLLARGAQTFTGYAVAGEYTESSEKNQINGTFTLEPVDIGGSSANPIYG